MKQLVLLLLVAACASENPKGGVSVRADGSDVVLEGDRPLRALVLDLAWDTAGGVTTIAAGPDAARMNEVKSLIAADGLHARVVLTDSRQLRLPSRGVILHTDGAIRIVDAQAADEDSAGRAIAVEVTVK